MTDFSEIYQEIEKFYKKTGMKRKDYKESKYYHLSSNIHKKLLKL